MRRLVLLLFGDFRVSWLRTILQLVRGRRVLVGRRFRLQGVPELVDGRSRLTLGTRPYGFATGRDAGILRVRGTLRIHGRVAIGVGSRIEVASGALADIGEDTYFSPNVRIIVSSGLTVGRGCAIGWDVQMLDDDQHVFRSGSREQPRSAPIVLGDHVWVGSRAMIFKGVEIADGCVIASGAVVTRSVDEPNSLVAGNPASVVRRGISWK